MSAALLSQRQGLLVQRNVRSSARSSAVLSRPKPFSPARRVFTRAAQPEAEAAASEQQQLEDIEGPLDALLFDEENEQVEMDEDTLAAAAAAKELVSAYDDEVVLEADLEDTLSPQAKVVSKAEAALESILMSGAVTSGQQAAALAVAGSDSVEAETVEDFQGPAGFSKYDEEAESGLSEEQRAAVAKYKLTKNELANLVPQDWDTINVDWFTNKREDNIPLPEYKLSFLWQEKNIAVSVDQVYSRGQISPLTEFFFWPRKDAWEELKAALEARPWIAERDKVILLNRLTEVINFWQDEKTKHTAEEARSAFPDCAFTSA
mmetsp:Transcript_5259/g.11525  ORF Transcript_5259/g.11525 Transcript_5259/m.11525 type:complete len:320 (-) Transcript_5259:430-1389(-)